MSSNNETSKDSDSFYQLQLQQLKELQIKQNQNLLSPPQTRFQPPANTLAVHQVSSGAASPNTTTVGRFTVKKLDASTSPSTTIDLELPIEAELSMCKSIISALKKEKEKLEQEVNQYRESNYTRLLSETKKREVTSGFWRGGYCALDEQNLAQIYCIQCKKKYCKKCAVFIHHYPHKSGHKQVRINRSSTELDERNYRILLQGFNWESSKQGRWYHILKDKSSEIKEAYITTIWFPPPSESVAQEGYMPGRYYNLNSQYGTYEDLKAVIEHFRKQDIEAMCDIVINHRTAQEQSRSGRWNVYGGLMAWDSRAIVANQADFGGKGNPKGMGGEEVFTPAPNIDHSQEFVREDIKKWLNWLKMDVGFDCFRFDYVKGYWGGYLAEYIKASMPAFAVGESWNALEYSESGGLEYDQDHHRQALVDWIDSTDAQCTAFDFTTKGILQEALSKMEYWRLRDNRSSPPGLIGWYPSHAVTFLENHDTGSTQGHWPFPSDKILQGYAYILTHPGVPCIFWDHLMDWGPENAQAIKTLALIRKRNKIHAESKVFITTANADIYAAIIDNRVAMKIGTADWSPSNTEEKEWTVATCGPQFCVWESKKVTPVTSPEVGASNEVEKTPSDEEEEEELTELTNILKTSKKATTLSSALKHVTFSPSIAASDTAPINPHKRSPSLQLFSKDW